MPGPSAGRIALHEAFAIAVEQKDGAFAAAAFGQQHARAGHAGGVELPELHVFQRMPARAAMPRPSPVLMKALVDAAGRYGLRRRWPAARSWLAGCAGRRFPFQGGHADHVAVGVADQVQRHPLHEEVGLGPDVLLVQRVQHGVAGAVGGGAGALHGLFAVVGGVAAEGALVDGAVGLRSNGMPKCSSSYTTLGASRHMNSMASWSPSQSEPLMVS